MLRFRWVLIVLLILSFLAIGSAGWTEGKHKRLKDRDGWDEQWDKGPDAHPPGWHKGKKTGWRGHDLPPGQQKKYRQGYKTEYEHERDRHGDKSRQQVTPVPVPIPVLVPR